MVYKSFFRFYGIIVDLLTDRTADTNSPVEYHFDRSPSVKDAIESLGPPHTEVTAIIVNGKPQSFDYLLQGNEEVDVYSFDKIPGFPHKLLLPNKPQGVPKFILDVHLGGLARYLRFFGFDTIYEKIDPGDKALVEYSCRNSRVLLTRDIGLLKHAKIRYGYWLRNTRSEEQFLEIARRYDLNQFFAPFTRCSICNGLICDVKKTELKDRISSSLYNQFDEFWECMNCKNVYWKGNHYYSIKRQLDDLINQLDH